MTTAKPTFTHGQVIYSGNGRQVYDALRNMFISQREWDTEHELDNIIAEHSRKRNDMLRQPKNPQ